DAQPTVAEGQGQYPGHDVDGGARRADGEIAYARAEYAMKGRALGHRRAKDRQGGDHGEEVEADQSRGVAPAREASECDRGAQPGPLLARNGAAVAPGKRHYASTEGEHPKEQSHSQWVISKQCVAEDSEKDRLHHGPAGGAGVLW